MSIDHYMYVGYYLKGKPKTVRIEDEAELCPNDHEKPWSEKGDFCSQCGGKFEMRTVAETVALSFYLEELIDYEVITEEEADRLENVFHELPSNSNATNILIIDDYAVTPGDWVEETPIDKLLKVNADDINKRLKDEGLFELLSRIYDSYELKFGLVQGWA